MCHWNYLEDEMCQKRFSFLMVLVTLLASKTISVPLKESHLSTPSLCSRAHAPVNATKGVNRVSTDNWDPLYKLELSGTEGHEYRVSVKLGSRLLPFSDAVISLETNGSCGVGELIYDNNDFFQVDQPRSDCPLLLMTNRKSVMQNLPPLRWKAPQCGCVHFRVMILESSTIYYVEEAKVVSGSLAVTLCIHALDHQHKLSVEERMELLCKVTARFSGLELLQRHELLQRRRLEPRYLDLHKTELTLATRRSDISLCCTKLGDGRSDCFRDIRRSRVDNFCEDGSPDVPFTASRSRFMRDREEACCWRLGESRYSCFDVEAGTKYGAWSADFSLDESNPLNDLADYPEEIRQLEKEYGARIFPNDNPSTPTTTITPTTTTVTTTDKPAAATASRDEPGSRDTGKMEHRSGSKKTLGSSGREGTSLLAEVAETPEDERNEPTRGGQSRHVSELLTSSGEIVGQQNAGGSSIDRTFYKLQRQMWKLSLRTQCCQNGVTAASSAYGDFSAIWQQCSHSASKYLQQLQLQHGHRVCETQFQRCCLETAVSSPLEVVTWKPEQASSREWDRDRHLVNTVYIPPHSRGPSPSVDAPLAVAVAAAEPNVQTWQERRETASSADGRQGGLSLRSSLRTTSSVDEPEADEEPRNHLSPKSRHPSSKERRAKQTNSKENLEAQQEDPVDGPQAKRAAEARDWHSYQHNQRRSFRTSRERIVGGSSRRSERKSGDRGHEGRPAGGETEAEKRRAARLRFVDEPELPEEPEHKRPSGRRRAQPTTRGRSQAGPSPRANARAAEAEGQRKSSDSLTSRTQSKTEDHTQRANKEDEAKSTRDQQREIHAMEVEQLETLFTELADDLQENHKEALPRQSLERKDADPANNERSKVGPAVGEDENDAAENEDENVREEIGNNDNGNVDGVLDDSDEEEEITDNTDDERNGDDVDNDDDDGEGSKGDARNGVRQAQAAPREASGEKTTATPAVPGNLQPHPKQLQARWRAGFQSLENSRGVHSGGVSRNRRRKPNSGVRRKKPQRDIESARRMRSQYMHLDKSLEED